MMTVNRLVFTLFMLALLTLVTPALALDTSSGANDQVVIDAPGIVPEGVVYDAAGERFLFGSLSQGTIRQISDDGTVSTFVEDADLTSTVGLHIDTESNRLLVCDSDAAVFGDPPPLGKAALAAYDLDTGERLFYVDLVAVASDGRNFANDVTVDADGNAYVTNSFTPVIYKVDLEGNAEVFARDDRFGAEGAALNGIDYHPDGYLLAANLGAGKLYKIPLDDPANITEVELGEWVGADGIALGQDGTLYAVAYLSSQMIIAMTSEDDWASAQIDARVETGGAATTLALRDDEPWYINAHLEDWASAQYEIVRANLEAG